MAVLKCKMCGADLNIAEGSLTTECEYCGTTQTVPVVDNEKKVNLFNRANRLRMNSEFDKAASIYEQIIAEFPEEAEAYWGLCLCNYGIEYVDDPATALKKPTIHRASFEKLRKDENYELALENADISARVIYEDSAREIDRIISEILSISANESPYDIFICYKETDNKGGRTIDSVLAQDIYDLLTAKGYKVFFSRITFEAKLGLQYEPYIFAALNSAKVMLAIGTDYEYYNAVWVKNEWSRFIKLMAKDKSKLLIPCFKGIDAYDMPDEFKLYQSQDMGKVGAMQDLMRGIDKIFGKTEQAKDTEKAVQQSGPNVEALVKLGNMALEDSKWDKANGYFEEALKINAECAEAYFGLCLAENKCNNSEMLIKKFNPKNKNYQRAKKFASGDFLEKLNTLETKAEEYKAERQRLAEEERKKAEEYEAEQQRKTEEESKRKAEELRLIREKLAPFTQLISAGNSHSAGLKSYGTVVAVGYNDYDQCKVESWKDIVAISAGYKHTVGLKKDGTVVATRFSGASYEYKSQCDVKGWTDIIAVSAGCSHTVGLKKDGTVVATKFPRVRYIYDGQCDVENWTDIVAIAAADEHTVGLKKDGTVVATRYTGDKEYYCNQCDVESWTDIVAVSAGEEHTVGLKKDGTVVAVGDNRFGRCKVESWKDIVAVSAGKYHTVGLKKDGTVVAVGDIGFGRCKVESWKDIVAVSAGEYHTVGLKKDGTVVATKYIGKYSYGRCNVESWKLFDDFENYEAERDKIAEEKARKDRELAEKQEKIKAEKRAKLEAEKSLLRTELVNLVGLFTGKRRKEIEARIAQIENEISELNKEK